MGTPISLKTTDNDFLIRIDKKSISQDVLLRLLEKINIEFLAQKIDFQEDIIELGEEIKADWWQKNKAWFLNPER